MHMVDLLKVDVWEKKEEIWLSPMTKAPTPTEMSKRHSDNKNNATKKFDYTAVADRLRTVSWSNYSHPTGVVYRFYRAHLPTHRNSCVIKGKNMQILLYSNIKVTKIQCLKDIQVVKLLY